MSQLALIPGVDYAEPTHTQALSTITDAGMLLGMCKRYTYIPSGDTVIRIGPWGGTTVNHSAANQMGFFQIYLFDRAMTISTSRVSLRAAGSIAGTVRVAIFNIASDGSVGTVVGQSDSTVVPTVAGIIDLTWTTPCSVSAGAYYVGFKTEFTGTTPQWASMTQATWLPHGFGFLTGASNTANNITGYIRNIGAGAFPDMTGLSLTPHYATAIPTVGFAP